MKPGISNSSVMQGIGIHMKKFKQLDNKDGTRKHNRITKDDFEELMEMKKERNRLENSRLRLFRSVGLCLSLLIVILAFNWKFPDNSGLMDLGDIEGDLDEIMDIPVSSQPPPPPPTKAPEVFKIVEVEDKEVLDDIVVDLDIEANEETVIEEAIVYAPIEEVEEEVVEEIFNIVEEEPAPVGGFKVFNQYLAENINYPRAAMRLNVSGRVFLKFVVEKDGSLTDIQVVKGIGAGCDEEAVRVIEKAPKWKPGKQRGVPVRVYKIVPIFFDLRNS